jgi:hypothetical protein
MPDGMRTSTLLVCLGLAGCHIGGSGSGGSNTFYFDNCGPDCSLSQHTVAAGGGHTTVDVTVPFAAVQSSNPSVARFTKNGSRVEVDAGVPGTTMLQVLDASGRILAQAQLTVEATATLTISRGWQGAAPVVLEGQPLVLHVTTHNARGDITKGDGSVSFALSGSLMNDIVPVSGDAIGFVGSPGSGNVTASCTSATLGQPITVVPATALTGLNLSGTTQPNEQAIVSMVPQSSSGPVYAGPCRWTTSDPSVTLASDIGPSLELGPGTLSVFNLTRPGSFTVTCQLAGLSSSVTLTR